MRLTLRAWPNKARVQSLRPHVARVEPSNPPSYFSNKGLSLLTSKPNKAQSCATQVNSIAIYLPHTFVKLSHAKSTQFQELKKTQINTTSKVCYINHFLKLMGSHSCLRQYSLYISTVLPGE